MKYPIDLFERGACRGADIEAFFPVKGVVTTENRAAVRVCLTRCDVVDQCLEWALDNERHGIWGGTTAKERSQIRARRGILVEEPQYRAAS